MHPLRSAERATGTRSGRRALGWALRAAASVLVLLAVARVVGLDALRAGTAVLTPGPVAAAVVVGLVWRGLAAARWVLVARALGARLAWPPAWAEYLRGELLNQVLPGAVLGDVDRARRHGQDVGLLTAARAVAVERLTGHVVLVVAVVVVLLGRPELRVPARAVDGRTVAVVAGAVALAAVVGVLLWRRRPGTAATADPSGPVRVRALLPALAAGAGLSVGVLACFVGLFVLAARVTGAAAGTAGTAGLAAPAALADLVPAVLVVLVLAGVPLTVSGWGAREAGAALCFAAVGLDAAEGVAAAVGYGLLSLVSALPGLVPLLLPRQPCMRGTSPSASP